MPSPKERGELANEAIEFLLRAARWPRHTIQQMPEAEGVRYEVIEVSTGDLYGVVHVARDGSITTDCPE